uniref:CCHC-type domain-containing protein n=1 Tax=Strongyloides venezuelensis TaxID=75913 RepID=A0A0K0FEP7_STRVS
MRSDSTLSQKKSIVLSCLEVLNKRLTEPLSPALLDRIASENIKCADYSDKKRSSYLQGLLEDIDNNLSSDEEPGFAKSLINQAVSFLSTTRKSTTPSETPPPSIFENEINSRFEEEAEEMTRTFIQLGKYNEKSGPIKKFLCDFEDLLIVDNIIADNVKKAALRTLLPFEIRTYLEANSTPDGSYNEMKSILMEKYDGVVARRIASDKIRYFKLKYNENELENSINAFEDRYTSIAEVASDLQVIHNDNVRLSKTHNQSNHRRKEMIKTREDKKNDLSCRGCFNKGHKVSDCRYKNVECKKCRGKGHYANKCPVQTSSQPTVSNNLRTLTIHSSDNKNPWEKLKNCMMITTGEVESTGKLADAQISDYVSSNGEGIKELAEKCDKNLLSTNYVNEKCDEKTLSKKCVIKDCDKEVISKIYVNNETNGILPSKKCEKLSKRVTTNSCDVYVKVEFEDGFIAPGIVDSGCQRSSISLNRAKILGYLDLMLVKLNLRKSSWPMVII